MSLINWDPEDYGLEITEMDEQHQKLIEILNKLHDSMKKGLGRVAVGDSIKELINYTEYHFCAEENLFCGAGYARAEEHKQSHCIFKEKLLEFEKQFGLGETQVAIEVFRFLCDWIDRHIRKSDKDYAPIVLDSTGPHLRFTAIVD